MLRTALALALTLAAAANAAQSLGPPRELAPPPALVSLEADARAQLDALCAELEAAAKNSRHGVSAKTDGGTGARVPSTAEGVCEIFVIEGEVVVAGTKAQFLSHDPVGFADSYSLYAFAGFDPINNWDPFGLSNTCLAGDLVCSKKKPEVWKLPIWRAQEGTLEPFPHTFSNPKLDYQKDIATVGATTGTEAALAATLPSAAAAAPGLLSRLANWVKNIFRPKPPVITLPGSVPVRPPEAPAPPAPTPRPPPAPTPPPAPPPTPPPTPRPVVGGGAKLENLNPTQQAAIQNFANENKVPVTVIGSRAAGTATKESDWDYVIPGANRGIVRAAERSLPRGPRDSPNKGVDIDRRGGTIDPTWPQITFKPQ